MTLAPVVHLIPTTRPIEEETTAETFDRFEATLLALVGDVAHLRQRLKEGAS